MTFYQVSGVPFTKLNDTRYSFPYLVLRKSAKKQKTLRFLPETLILAPTHYSLGRYMQYFIPIMIFNCFLSGLTANLIQMHGDMYTGTHTYTAVHEASAFQSNVI